MNDASLKLFLPLGESLLLGFQCLLGGFDIILTTSNRSIVSLAGSDLFSQGLIPIGFLLQLLFLVGVLLVHLLDETGLVQIGGRPDHVDLVLLKIILGDELLAEEFDRLLILLLEPVVVLFRGRDFKIVLFQRGPDFAFSPGEQGEFRLINLNLSLLGQLNLVNLNRKRYRSGLLR